MTREGKKTVEELLIENAQLKKKISELEKTKISASTGIKKSPVGTKKVDLDFNKQYQALIEKAPDGVVLLDTEGNFKYLSPSAKKMFGYQLNDKINKNPAEYTHPDDLPKVLAELIKILEDPNYIPTLEYRFIDKQGNWHWVETTFSNLLANPSIESIVLNFRDITERKNEENILKIQLKLFEYAINHSETDFLQKFLDEAEEITASNIGFYHYIEDDQESISLQTWSSNTLHNMCKGIGENTRHYPISKAGVWVDCIKERKPVVHNDYISLPHKKGLPDGHAPIIRELVVPVIRGNEIKAVLGVGNKTSDYTEADVKNLQRLADVAWETVVRKQAEEKTHIAEKNLKDTFDVSPSIIAKANLNTGYFTEANQAVTRILGYSIKEFTTTPFIELIHPDDQQTSVDEKDEQLKGKEVTSFENRYLCKDGSYKWIAWHGTSADKDGTVTAIGSDINERKIAEQQISENQFYLTKAQELGKIGTWKINIKNNALTWTDETYKIFGLLPGTPVNFEIFMGCVHPDDRGFINQEWATKMMTNNYDVEHRIIVNGEVKWVREKAEISYNKTGEPIEAIGFVQDITERKIAEEAIVESEEKFRNIFENSTDGKSITHFDGCIKTNAAYCKIVGYSQEELSKLKWQSITHPDDIEANISISNSILSGEKNFERWEKRYIKKNGDIVWVDISTTLQRDNENKPLYFITSIIDITEQKQVRQQLITAKQKAEESEEKFRTLSENSPAIIYRILLQPSFKFDYVSPVVYEITGYSPEDHYNDPDLGFKMVHPDDRILLEDAMQKTKGEPVILRWVRKDGKAIWTEQRNVLIYNEAGNPYAIEGIATDITAQKDAEEKLTFQANLLSQISEAVVATDVEGAITYWNLAAEKLYGWKSKEVIGKSIQEITPASSPKEQATIFINLLTKGQSWTGELIVKNKEGCSFPIMLNMSPMLDTNHNIMGVIGVSSDISERKKTEQALITAMEKAQESDRLKSAFLANMSHEIRTPMNGILGFTNLLQQPDLTGTEQQEYIKIIQTSGNRMLNTVNDIIDISRIESGLAELLLSEVNIEDQLKELHRFFIPEAAKKGIKLKLKNDRSDQNNKLITDAKKFNSILTNLIKNAIKYTEKGFIEFGYRIMEKTDAGTLIFYVKDSGIGIPKNRHQAIFERFVQADIEDKMARQGSGLGLAISKAYAEMLGGKLWLESEEGKGSTFYFTMENTIEAKSNSIAESKGQIVEKNSLHEKLNILLVEDDETSLHLITILLEKFTRKSIKVSSGSEAVETCRRNPDIDLILMDIQLPDINGYEATRMIRQFNKEVIIFAQTAFALSGDREKAISMGCTDYISKPINKAELDSAIKKYAKKYPGLKNKHL